jgi:serine/threonine-protein kinase
MSSKRVWQSNKNKYRYIRRIGEGGNGVVYEVEDQNGKQFALKQLFNIENKKAYKRFKAEIKVLSQLKGQKGIIEIMDSHFPDQPNHNKYPFYVMPIGKPFTNLLIGKPDENLFKSLILLCNSLIYLHSLDITHRDIKPANMLALHGGPVFSDFGLANFPHKEHISAPDEQIGAKWTIAPEMKRISSAAEYKKADVYSMAKTLWILITKQSKGFEGQYIPQSSIGLKNFIDLKINTTTVAGNWYYHSIVLLDKLLVDSTSNDPGERPTIDEFTSRLKYWLHSNEEYFERNPYEWKHALDRIFPVSIPYHAEWDLKEDIFKVLQVLTQYDNLNHMFYPSRGGMDMDTVEFAQEHGCLILLNDVILKPKQLLFDMIDDYKWSYFRLQCDKLTSLTGVRGIREEMFLDESGTYVKETEPYINRVSRFLSGSFVITFKMSAINQISGLYNAYSGFHNKLSAAEYRKTLDTIKNDPKTSYL